MADPSIQVVRAPAWQGLVRRLDAAVAAEPRLSEARNAVLRPIEILRALAADAPGALADDVLVADRLRAVLFLCWPYAAVTLEARALLDASAGGGDREALERLFSQLSSGGAAAAAWPAEQPAEPGVIDHAALLLVMLAAARVADPPFAPVFLATVHGIALSASAAEVLGRLDPRQPDADGMRIVLETLYLVDAARVATKNEFLRPFVLDPVERGRWRCLESLFHESALAKLAGSMGPAWDGATSHEILDVSPRSAAVGEVIVVSVSRGPAASNPLENSEVVFAAPGAPLLPARAKLIESPPVVTGALPPLQIEVEVPAGAAPGWLGFSRSNWIATSNAQRAELRSALVSELAEPCVAVTGDASLTEFVADYGARATPRRRGHNRFEGGDAAVSFAAFSPAEVAPGVASELSWDCAGSAHVEVSVAGKTLLAAGPPSGRLRVLAPASDDQDLVAIVTPFALRAGTLSAGAPRRVTLVVRAPLNIGKIEVTQAGATPEIEGVALELNVHLSSARSEVSGALSVDGAGAPAIEPSRVAPGLLVFEVPARLVENGMTLTLTVTLSSGQSVTRALGPYALRSPRSAQVVLACPAIASLEGLRLDVTETKRRIVAIAAGLGLDAQVSELPFCADDVAVMVDSPSSDGDTALFTVLEGLADSAALTPGFEAALWLAVVPSPDAEPRSVASSVAAYAARAVAVATLDCVAQVLRDVFVAPNSGASLARTARAPEARVTAAVPHLAVVGSLDDADDEFEVSAGIDVREVRVDVRRSGDGAPFESGYELASLSADGRELNRQPLRVVSPLKPARVSVLVPVNDDVVVVELRYRGRVVKAFRRARGSLSIEVANAPNGAIPSTLDWQWHHTHNARPRVSLLLRRGELETPAHDIDPCHTHATLPLWRFLGRAKLALYASDGWNSAVEAIGKGELNNEAAVVVRRLSDGRFFADTPPGWELVWRLNGEERGHARTLPLAAADSGLLELEARSGKDVVRDSREVIAGARA